ncbi:MAG TPA: ABC transporter permease [Candidatus Acidoferrales bacterium]|nr:ABC transporter permease [Candidatus Acidoferrales bacterium]
MFLYVLRRLFHLVPVLLFVSLIVFLIVHLIPGDPVDAMLGEQRYDREQYEIVRRKMGLDKPLYAQYAGWLGRVLQGDFGESIRNQRPVLDAVIERYPATIYLAMAALLIGISIAIPAGTVAAVRQNTLWDYSAMSFALFGIAVPNFWLALLLILGLGLYLGWFPTLGYTDPTTNFALFLHHLALPALVLGTDMASAVTRYVRAEMLEQLRLDYVRTARAKGLPRRLVIYKHTLRNSLIAATTVIGLHVGRLLGGSTVVEMIFAWPGVARLVLDAVYSRDYPLLQGAVLFLACTYVCVNLIVDLLYKWLDPRIAVQ